MILKVTKTIILIGIINFLLFFIDSSIIGGDAITGKGMPVSDIKITGNHYYVGSHGEYKEVSKSAYAINLILEYALIVTIPAALVSCVVYYRNNFDD